jgi:hypothetical protein
MNAYAVVCLLPPVLQLVACWVKRDVELPLNEPIRSIIIPSLLYYWWKYAFRLWIFPALFVFTGVVILLFWWDSSCWYLEMVLNQFFEV